MEASRIGVGRGDSTRHRKAPSVVACGLSRSGSPSNDVIQPVWGDNIKECYVKTPAFSIVLKPFSPTSLHDENDWNLRDMAHHLYVRVVRGLKLLWLSASVICCPQKSCRQTSSHGESVQISRLSSWSEFGGKGRNRKSQVAYAVIKYKTE